MQQKTKTEKQCVFSQHVEIYDSTQAEKLLHDTIHESLWYYHEKTEKSKENIIKIFIKIEIR